MSRLPTVRIVQAVMVVVVVAWGAYVFLDDDPAPTPQPVLATWTYIVDENDIEQVTFRSGEVRAVYRKVNDGWTFEAPGETVAIDAQRWSTEVLLLLGGPAANRALIVPDAELALLGLAPPRFEIELALRGDRIVRVLVGTATPDARNHYVRIDGQSEVALVPVSWADALLPYAGPTKSGGA